MKKYKNLSLNAFTIVELLVVIVVIGILATITIVSYTGISSKATIVGLQSDLSQAAQKIKLFAVDNGYFPTSISDCPSPQPSNMCLVSGNGSFFSSWSSTATSFTLVETTADGFTSWKITDSTAPSAVNGKITKHTPYTTTLSVASRPGVFTITKDGLFAYVSDYGNSRILMYSRNKSTGQLTALSPASIDCGGSCGTILLSPDDAFMYAHYYTGSSSSAVATVMMYGRDSTTGLLTPLSPASISQNAYWGFFDFDISPDGLFVYAPDQNGHLFMFNRNPSTGQITGLVSDTSTGGDLRDFTISPDGLFAYYYNLTNSTIRPFSRNPSTGVLTALSPSSVASTLRGQYSSNIYLTPDGLSLYVTHMVDYAIVAFSRNPTTGQLTYVDKYVTSGNAPEYITASPDNLFIYVHMFNQNNINVHNRNPKTSALTLNSTVSSSCLGPLLFAPDGSFLYQTYISTSNNLCLYDR